MTPIQPSSSKWQFREEGSAIFVCIEGADAAGKHTQSELLAQHLGARLFSFPDYETPMGLVIKGHLKRYWSARPCEGEDYRSLGSVAGLNAHVFQSLQLTNRMEHAVEMSMLLRDGVSVVADRYWPSGLVYGQADGLDPAWVDRIQAHLPQPDLYLLIDPSMSAERRPERRDRYEMQEGLMERVTGLYRKLWIERRRLPGNENRWVVIDGRPPIEEVTQQINDAVEVWL